MSTRHSKRWPWWLTGVCLMAAAVAMQCWMIASWQPENLHNYIVVSDPGVSRLMSCGNTAFMADMAWLRMVQYFGGNFSTLAPDPVRSQAFNQMAREKGAIMRSLIENVTYLDPYFMGGYEFGAFVLANSVNDPTAAIQLYDKGFHRLSEPGVQAAFPKRWELAYHGGYVARYNLSSCTEAIRLYRAAASVEGAPSFLVRVAQESERECGVANVEALLAELHDQYLTVSHPVQQEIIKGHVRRMVNDDNLALYALAQETYLAQTGVAATTMCQLNWTPGVMASAWREFVARFHRPPLVMIDLEQGNPEGFGWAPLVEGQPPVDPHAGSYVLLETPDGMRVAAENEVLMRRASLQADIDTQLGLYANAHGGKYPPEGEGFWGLLGYERPPVDDWNISPIWDARARTATFPSYRPACPTPPDQFGR